MFWVRPARARSRRPEAQLENGERVLASRQSWKESRWASGTKRWASRMDIGDMQAERDR